MPFGKSADLIGIVALFARRGRVPSAGDLTPLSGMAGLLLIGWDRLRAQRALRQTQLLADAVLETIPDAAITYHEDGAIASVNSATVALFDYPAPELIGRKIAALLDEGDRRDGEPLGCCCEEATPWIRGVGRYAIGRRADGSTFPARLSIGGATVDGRRLFVGVLHDLTARQRLEQELRQAHKMEMIGRLACCIVHDFNNLLAVINGYADLVASEVSHPPAVVGHLASLRDVGERAAALIRQLLAFSRRQSVQLALVDLNAVVTGMHGMLSRLIGDTVEIRTTLAEGLPPIRADRSQIEQVIMNLVLNARDAMPNGGNVSIATRRVLAVGAAPRVRLSVTDDGHGLSPEIRDRLFEPFFTTKDPGRGTGLGLLTVHRVVKEHDGTIVVESAPGRGASFILEFPASGA